MLEYVIIFFNKAATFGLTFAPWMASLALLQVKCTCYTRKRPTSTTYLQPCFLLLVSFAGTSLVHGSLVLLCLRDALGVSSVFFSVEILTTVHTGQHVALPALIPVVLLHLVLLQRGATSVTGEKHHYPIVGHVQAAKPLLIQQIGVVYDLNLIGQHSLNSPAKR